MCIYEHYLGWIGVSNLQHMNIHVDHNNLSKNGFTYPIYLPYVFWQLDILPMKMHCVKIDPVSFDSFTRNVAYWFLPSRKGWSDCLWMYGMYIHPGTNDAALGTKYTKNTFQYVSAGRTYISPESVALICIVVSEKGSRNSYILQKWLSLKLFFIAKEKQNWYQI